MSRNSLSLETVSTRGLFFQGGNSPVNFLQDCLSNSVSYHRAAGYFSSSVYLAAQESLTTFIGNGGIIKLVCSPRLMPEDLEAIEQGQQSRLVMEKSLERILDAVFSIARLVSLRMQAVEKSDLSVPQMKHGQVGQTMATVNHLLPNQLTLDTNP